MAGPVAGRPQTDAGSVCVFNVRASEPEKTNWELQNQEANCSDGKISFTVMGHVGRRE